jgi:hypothetical protein
MTRSRTALGSQSTSEGTQVHVLAIGHLTGKDIQPHLAAEGQAVAEMKNDGFIRDVFLKGDRTEPILVLNDTNAEEARQRLDPSRAADRLAGCGTHGGSGAGASGAVGGVGRCGSAAGRLLSDAAHRGRSPRATKSLA